MLERIREILKKYAEVSADLIVPDATLQGDLALNSLDVVNIVMDFEDEFGIEIEDDAVGGFITVADIVKYMELHQR